MPKTNESRSGRLLLTDIELARELREKQRTIKTWRDAGIIPCVELRHRTIRFRLSAVVAALEKREVPAITSRPRRGR